MPIMPFEEIETILGPVSSAFMRLLGSIRIQYAMDEIWDGRDELKFRRGDKTLATLYIHEGWFTLLLIYGKREREAFEAAQERFPIALQKKYAESRTYHDGKWIFIDIRDETLIDALIAMLHIKKKPNRKKEKLAGAAIGRCGNRCDQCLLNVHNETPDARTLFSQGDHRCYHSRTESEVDYSQINCPGCHDDCKAAQCALSHGYESCRECDYHTCSCQGNNFTHPGRCNLGLTNEDIERFVLPYCGKERFDAMK